MSLVQKKENRMLIIGVKETTLEIDGEPDADDEVEIAIEYSGDQLGIYINENHAMQIIAQLRNAFGIRQRNERRID